MQPQVGAAEILGVSPPSDRIQHRTGGAREARAQPSMRLPELDALRAVAILLVLGRHCALPPQSAGVLAPAAFYWNRIGWSGVDLFFVLSGFLVGGLLFKELRDRGQLDARRFLIRRGFKIWPAYIVYVFALYIALVLVETKGNLGEAFLRLWPNLAHVQNYFGTPRNHTWSLAVEEHFYLALPLLLYCITRRKPHGTRLRAVPWIVAVSVLGCTALRYFNVGRPFDLATHFFPTHLRIDGLLIGVFLAYLHHFHSEALAVTTRYHLLLICLGVVLVMPIGFLSPAHPYVWTIGFAVLYVGYALILLGVLYAPSGGIIRAALTTRVGRALSFVGFYSYVIYLWHVDLASRPVIWLFRHLPWEPSAARWVVGMSLYVALACVVGLVMAKLVETPALRVRDRLFPSRAGALGSLPSRDQPDAGVAREAPSAQSG